jgi:hypothetical protein
VLKPNDVLKGNGEITKVFLVLPYEKVKGVTDEPIQLKLSDWFKLWMLFDVLPPSGSEKICKPLFESLKLIT